MQALRADVRAVAPTDLTVVIQGERGTGKELVANEIHLQSERANAAFVKLNCASLTESLAETELFGCEKGAFTGAEFRKGPFEQAHAGTLFLDEIGELPLRIQAKFLRVVETREVNRVGGRGSIPVNFRLIVATNRDLKEMARAQKFRADLYDRLNMATIRTPPLRQRLDDIPLIAEYLMNLYGPIAKRQVTGLAQEVLDLFRKYSWPGNVRELENTVRRAVFTGHSGLIRLGDLPFDFAQNMAAAAPVTPGNHDRLVKDYSRSLILGALRQSGGNRTKARAILGLAKTRFYRLLKTHGLDAESGNGREEQDQNGEDCDWMP